MTGSPAGLVYLADVAALLLKFFQGEEYPANTLIHGVTLPSGSSRPAPSRHDRGVPVR